VVLNKLSDITEQYLSALKEAIAMMETTEIEPRSALKQAASDNGIPYGDNMGQFVLWAETQLF